MSKYFVTWSLFLKNFNARLKIGMWEWGKWSQMADQINKIELIMYNMLRREDSFVYFSVSMSENI